MSSLSRRGTSRVSTPLAVVARASSKPSDRGLVGRVEGSRTLASALQGLSDKRDRNAVKKLWAYKSSH